MLLSIFQKHYIAFSNSIVWMFQNAFDQSPIVDILVSNFFVMIDNAEINIPKLKSVFLSLIISLR